jgi:predicted ATP-grasp superfamily ATP-dependent carboligase
MTDLNIVGASVRAAAGSARRAGLVPWCSDLFGDTDLRKMVPTVVRCPASRYPRPFLDILSRAPRCPWMYTGALENHPELIRRMADIRPLWGNGPVALAASRSPFTVARLLREAGLPVPLVSADQPVGSGQWLRKPLRGAAGQGISFAGLKGDRGHYFQQFLPGPSMSAVFVEAGGDTALLGATEQLVGQRWLNARPFQYCGNMGPVPLTAELGHDLEAIGRVLGAGCELRGLFGVDFILHEGRPWVVEVNPRYPASVEVLERATGIPALPMHRTAFEPAAPVGSQVPAADRVVGKAILYAPRRVVVPEHDRIEFEHDAAIVADIPAAGEVIQPGWPILTALTEAASHEECRASLMERAARLKTVLLGEPNEM